jgi:hypothetical protein
MHADKIVIGVLVAALVGALAYLIYDLVQVNTNPTLPAPTTSTTPTVTAEVVPTVKEGFESNQAPVAQPEQQNMYSGSFPNECYPKDVLTAADLLPADGNSLYAQVNPAGQGALGDQNYLQAGYHIGNNTVSQNRRNGNLQLRSVPPNPQVLVSPWNQSTIEPDLMQRPFEFGGTEHT